MDTFAVRTFARRVPFAVFPALLSFALLAVPASLLSSCGGDGGGAPSAPAGSLDGSAAEADTDSGLPDTPVGQDSSDDDPAVEASDDAQTPDDGAAGDGGPCVPADCAALNANCGTALDGCGGTVECGTCPTGEYCGGGGANRCGTASCAPKTCVQVDAACGSVSDGCGGVISCGDCPVPTACGGSGVANQCGCVPKTCAQLGAECGTLPDLCTDTIDCGGCPSGQTCGGGGPNKCGTSSCAPKTCVQLGVSCGIVSDTCSAALDCGSCQGYDACGGSGVMNQCGCTAKTCAQLGASCGTVDSGCGWIDCGQCAPSDTCGGGGVESQCGCVCSAPHASTSCLGGLCNLASCSTGWADCNAVSSDGCETNVASEQTNCGGCGAVCSLAHATSACAAGSCNLIACQTPYADCDGSPGNGCEANLQADPQHCGTCNKVCTAPNGTPVCNAGVCGVSTCLPGRGDCDGSQTNGCEVDTTTSALHCGFCGNTCSFSHASAKCVSSACKLDTCSAGYGNCDGTAANGCETATGSSAQHCGSCGNACPSGPNASAACVSGTCALSCSAGFRDCDGNPSNGCEVDALHDPAHCGSCTTICSAAHGTSSCLNGQCSIASCQSGWGNCDGTSSNGCETSLASDPTHCGGCTTECSSFHGTPSCASGTCGITCAAGWSDCDGVASTGCETNTDADPTHCGGCATVCSGAGGTPVCVAGVCGVSSCQTGKGDCDGIGSNGCEADLKTDTANCGACGTVCPSTNGTPSCVNGTCAIACTTGWGNCDGTVSNGCEANLNTGLSHCGACGTACSTLHATPVCSSGTCQLTCQTGWGNCDGSAANGCEADLLGDKTHCGTCTTVCSTVHATPSCTGGACSLTCTSGWGNCDGMVNTGCETDLSSNKSHCGACGTVCTSNISSPVCKDGACLDELTLLIIKYYGIVLSREPLPNEIAAAKAEILDTVALEIDYKEPILLFGRKLFESPEYVAKGTTDSSFITAVFGVYLDKTPSPAEIDYWRQFLTDGSSRHHLVSGFAYRTEYAHTIEGAFGPSMARPEIYMVTDEYRGLFDRVPDHAGFAYWLQDLRGAQCSGDPVAVRTQIFNAAVAMMGSPEYVARHVSNRLYVEDLYDWVHRRFAAPSEVTYWADKLDSHALSPKGVLGEFLVSPEFEPRVAAIVGAGCP